MTENLAIHLTALGLVVLDILVRAWRLRLLIPGQQKPSTWQAVAVNAYGDAASAVTPARFGGEPARFLGLRRSGVDGAGAAVALGAELAIDWILIIAGSVVLALLFSGEGIRAGYGIVSILISNSALPWVLIVLLLVAASVVAARIYHRRNPGALHQSFKQALKYARSLSVGRLSGAALLTAVSMTARVAILPLILLPSLPEFSAGLLILGSFALLYSQLVLPTPSGLGGVEIGFAAGFAPSLEGREIVTLLLAWRFYTLFLGAALGAVLLARAALSRRSIIRAVGLAFLVAAIGAPTLQGQSEAVGSRNLPVDHWAYEYIKRLRTRGHLENLNPLVQPYRRIDVALGLSGLDPGALKPPVSGWVRLLREEFGPALTRLDGQETRAWGVELTGGARASTSQRLDVLRPLGEEEVWPRYTAAVWAEAGPLAAETRVLGDLYLNDDPDGIDLDQRRGGSTDNAYLSLRLPFGGLTLGRLKQNWSALGTTGLMVSDNPIAYPQLAFEARVGRFTFRSFSGELETLRDQKRYLAAHRLDYQSGNLTLSLGEALLYAGEAGLSLRFLNPLEFLFFNIETDPKDVVANLMLDFQFWYQGRRVVLFGEAMIDDIDYDPEGGDRAPSRHALSFGARFLIAPMVELGASYRQVSSFTYRTARFVDRYTFLRRGLGDNYSDYDRINLEFDFFPGFRGLRITPMLQLQRQGEGDVRAPFPSTSDFRASPTLFIGEKETTYRLGLAGRYQPSRFFWIAWDVGENFLRDARHISGNDVSEFSAFAAVGAKLDLPVRKSR